MPMERMSMRRVRDCLRLKSAGISTREIARRLGVASSTVRLTLRRCETAEIVWPLAPDMRTPFWRNDFSQAAGRSSVIGVVRVDALWVRFNLRQYLMFLVSAGLEPGTPD